MPEHHHPSRAALALALTPLLALACMTGSTDSAINDRVALLEGLGEHQYPVSTSDSLAQRYFDQGLRLTYAFNHAEAVRAFEEAARIDPECAMCHWGTALALGPNINAPMDSASAVRAFDAVRRAGSASAATERERALIAALATRYAESAPADRAALDSAYARAMSDVASKFPDDLEVQVLSAEAVMDLSPWNYWTADGTPRPGMGEAIARLERVLSRAPSHPGACHFFIHAVEAKYPERAVACAERLAEQMPAAGHIVHMPGHIYIRVGRYEDAIQANVHAIHADESYIADQRPSGIYPLMYYPHNYHFLGFASMMAGQGNRAIEAARALSERAPAELARQIPEIQGLMPYLHLVQATFGRWDDVLREPLPPPDLRFAFGMATYARGLASAARSDQAGASAALDTVRAIAAEVANEPMRTVLTIAVHSLGAEISAKGGDLPEAIAGLRSAVELEDGLMYIEPPYWHQPVRQMLGAALLDAGHAADAERVYREDLARFPENGWSLRGLARVLEAQGRTREAEEVDARFQRSWANADVMLVTSRF
ncbi:MAG TPA: tetratricopeptide repeat protein [Gemmatimonadaceae bacterium]|nr:tetratricopeptide repeat protein [Gemmatimonadaceae bacterium]